MPTEKAVSLAALSGARGAGEVRSLEQIADPSAGREIKKTAPAAVVTFLSVEVRPIRDRP